MARFIEVTIEWPGGSRVDRIEVPDDTTDAEAADDAKDAFTNVCNYGWEWVDG